MACRGLYYGIPAASGGDFTKPVDLLPVHDIGFDLGDEFARLAHVEERPSNI